MHFDCSQCKQKGTAALFLLLLLLFAAVPLAIAVNTGFIKLSLLTSFPQSIPVLPVTDTASKLSTYSNQALGFEFQYPSKGLTVKEDSEEEFNKRSNGDFRKNFTGYIGYAPGKFVGAIIVLDKTNSFDKSPLTVWVFDNPDKLTADGWFDKFWYYPFLWGVFDWVSKGHVAPDMEATISGRPARSKIVSYQPGKPKFIYVSKDQRMYLFRVIGESGDEILSTFKFLP